MSPDPLKLYHSPASPNSRRVRIFLAEKDLKVPLVAVDLGKGEHYSEAYRAINPRLVVPTLVLEDGTAIGEVPAIMPRRVGTLGLCAPGAGDWFPQIARRVGS